MKSSIYYIPDIEEAMMIAMNDSGPVQIMSLDESLPQSQWVMAATILLPPPVAMIAEADGKADEFYSIYRSYLATKDVSDFMNAMICFLFSNGNLILYVPKVFQSSEFIPVLFQHMYEVYGLKIGTKEQPFWYDNRYDPINFNILYSLNVIDAYTYLSIYPISLLEMSGYEKQIIGQKLYVEIQPLIPIGTDMDSLNLLLSHFEELRIKMKSNPNLREGLIYAEE